MSLDWNATKVAGFSQFDDEDRALTANYCWVLMAIGIGDVKPDNVGEIIFRTKMMRGLIGTMMTGSATKSADEVAAKLESVEFVSRLIGYHTNVGFETWTAWSKRMRKHHAGRFQNQAEALAQAVAEAVSA
jgi:hypothetical protein